MGTVNFSRHMIEDRTERYLAIATKVGFGEPLYITEKTNRYGLTIMQLTTTGVVIVKSSDGKLITMFCATVSIIKKYFQLEKMPQNLYTVVRNNEKKGYCNI